MIEHLPETIDPDEAPGGLVMIHYVDGEVGLQQKIPAGMLDSDLIPTSAAYASEQCQRWADEGREVVLRIHDGDTGRCVMTVVPEWAR